MKVKFNFNFEAWLDGVEVEADSYDEAVNKLNGMSMEEMLESGYIKQSEVTQVDGTVVERTVRAEAYNISYDVTEYDVDVTDEDTDEDVERKINDVLSTLPDKVTVEVDVSDDDDLEEAIADEITNKTDWLVKDFKFRIIEEK